MSKTKKTRSALQRCYPPPAKEIAALIAPAAVHHVVVGLARHLLSWEVPPRLATGGCSELAAAERAGALAAACPEDSSEEEKLGADVAACLVFAALLDGLSASTMLDRIAEDPRTAALEEPLRKGMATLARNLGRVADSLTQERGLARYVSVAEAARATGLPEATVQAHAERPGSPFFNLPGFGFRMTNLERYAEWLATEWRTAKVEPALFGESLRKAAEALLA